MTELEALVGKHADLVAWDNLESTTKQQIQQTLGECNYPQGIVYPHTQDSLREIVALAHTNQWQILPCGNGSKLSWGGLVTYCDLVVSTQKINRIVAHNVADLTVTVEAGTTLATLQSQLQATGQFIPIDPAYPNTATIGGIIATADSGSWRQRYGGVRDLVLGVSFVRADGQIAKAGGKVVKNVAGYDLMKLFTGSYGTLGIISQVNLRTYPVPAASTTVILTGTSEIIANAASILLASSLSPTCADILSESVVKQLELGVGMGLMVRFQSIHASVKEQAQQLQAMGEKLGLQVLVCDDNQEAELWRKFSQLLRFPTHSQGITCKIGVLPNRGVEFLNKLHLLTGDRGLGRMNMGSGLGHLHLDVDSPVEELRQYCQDYQGFLTILEAPVTVKQNLEPWGYTGNALELMGSIKQQFDPDNMFSPGRLF